MRRVYEYKNKLIEGFTKKYNLGKLIYFKEYTEVRLAIEKEKQIKDYRRKKKFALLTKTNPRFQDLQVM